MNALRNYLASLNARERWVLGSGFMATLGILFYALVFQPLEDELARLRLQVPRLAAEYRQMQQQSIEVRPLIEKQQQAVTTVTGPLLTVIERTAGMAKIRAAIKRMQPAENNQVKVWLSDLQFDDWLNWVNILHGQGIIIITTSVTRAEKNQVSIRVTFVRNG